MKRLISAAPLLVFVALALLLAWRLDLMQRGRAPDILPSALIGRPAPEFDLPPIMSAKPGFRTRDLQGRITLVNFFASWCPTCREEHPVLRALARRDDIALVGIVYKDKPENVTTWLARVGNPYAALAADPKGRAAIDFGLYGVPETYVIDPQGIVRFKVAGAMTPEIVRTQILPLLEEMKK